MCCIDSAVVPVRVICPELPSDPDCCCCCWRWRLPLLLGWCRAAAFAAGFQELDTKPKLRSSSPSSWVTFVHRRDSSFTDPAGRSRRSVTSPQSVTAFLMDLAPFFLQLSSVQSTDALILVCIHISSKANFCVN